MRLCVETTVKNATRQSSQTGCFTGIRKIASLIVGRSAGGHRPHTAQSSSLSLSSVIRASYTGCRPMLAYGRQLGDRVGGRQGHQWPRKVHLLWGQCLRIGPTLRLVIRYLFY
jgi:hypothetical protein